MNKKYNPYRKHVEDICKGLDALIKNIQDKYSFDVFPELKRLRNNLEDKRFMDDNIEALESYIHKLFLFIQALKIYLVKDFNIKGLNIKTDTEVNSSLEDFE